MAVEVKLEGSNPFNEANACHYILVLIKVQKKTLFRNNQSSRTMDNLLQLLGSPIPNHFLKRERWHDWIFNLYVCDVYNLQCRCELGENVCRASCNALGKRNGTCEVTEI